MAADVGVGAVTAVYSGCGSLTVEVLFIVQFSSFTLNDTSVIRAYSATQAY